MISMSYEVSVVITVFNKEKYLNECLDSVVNQTLGIDNIEVICVNDNSTDGSLAILEEYANKYPSFKIINHGENKGSGPAKNNGISHVTSNYVTFLDSDDFLDKDILKDSLDLIKKNDCDIIYYNWEIFPVDEDTLHKPHITSNRVINSVEDEPSIIFATSAGFKIFNKNIYEYLHFTDFYDDNVASVECLLNSKKIFLSKSTGYFYRSTPNSITNNISFKNLFYIIKCIGDLFCLCNKYPSKSKYIKLLIIKFMDDFLGWFQITSLSDKERLLLLNNLIEVMGNISQYDIDFFKEVSSYDLMYSEYILNVGKHDYESLRYMHVSRNYRIARLYVDTGNGWNDEEKIEIFYNIESDKEICFNLDSFENIKRLSFNPIALDFSKIKILDIDSDAKRIKIKKSSSINNLKDDYQLFKTTTPNYILKGNFKNISYIKFNFNLTILNEEDLENSLDEYSKNKHNIFEIVKSKLK